MITLYFEKELFSDIVYYLLKYKNIDVLKNCDKDRQFFQFNWCNQTRKERLDSFLLNIDKYSDKKHISIYIDNNNNNKYLGYDFGISDRHGGAIYYNNYFSELRKEKINRVLE